jgi:hypothetical protein
VSFRLGLMLGEVFFTSPLNGPKVKNAFGSQ